MTLVHIDDLLAHYILIRFLSHFAVWTYSALSRIPVEVG